MDKFWISYASFYLQVVSSDEWVLGIQISQFENVLNSEIKNGMYCCCDEDHCVEEKPSLGTCQNRCDNFFSMIFPFGGYDNHSATVATYPHLDSDVINRPVGWQIFLEQSGIKIEVGGILTFLSSALHNDLI